MSQYVEQDAVIQPELPARCLPPLFSGADIYSKRFVRLSRPPAGMSMLPVRAPSIMVWLPWLCVSCTATWKLDACGLKIARIAGKKWLSSDTVTRLHSILALDQP